MLKKAILFSILISSIYSYSQESIDIQIEVGAPYPTELEYYLQNADNLFISSTNTTNGSLEIYYHVQLIGDNGIDVKTLSTYKPPSPVIFQPFETKFYSGNELSTDFPFSYPEDVDITNITQEQYDFISFYRALPEGTYQICITGFDYVTDEVIALDCSSEFTVAYGDPPYIYMPLNEEEIQATSNSFVTIGWEPPFLSNPGLGSFSYTLEMIDITDFAFGDIELMFSNPGTYDILYVENLTSTIYNFSFPPENIALEVGHEYALRVRAVDPTSSTPLPNNGYSPISIFSYIEEEIITPPSSNDLIGDCSIPCIYTPSIPEVPATSLDGFEIIEIGNFQMDNITFDSSDPISASGNGRIAIPFLEGIYVDVTFSDVSINAQGRIYDGLVNAVVEYDPDTDNMTAEEAEAYDAYLRSERALSDLLGVESIGLPIAFEKGIGGTNLMFGISDITFSPTQATCSVIQNFHMPKLGFGGWAPMKGEEVCLLPGGIDDIFLQPQSDITIPYEGGIEIVISGGQEETGIDLNCQGIEQIKIGGEVIFPTTTLVKSINGSASDEEATGTFSVIIDGTTINQAVINLFGENGAPSENGINLIANLEMEPFHLAMLPDWGIQTGDIYIDLSDFENPPNLSWPDQYSSPHLNGNTMETTWHGVFIPGIDLLTPDNFLGLDDSKVIEINQILIDPNINLNVEVEDLITLNEGNIDGWAVSVDLLNISIVENALSEAGFNGRIAIPITGEDDNFEYDALISYDPNEDLPTYTLSISALNEISLPFAAAKATLSENSYITASFNATNESENYMQVFLEGGLAVQSQEFESSGSNNGGPPLNLPAIDFSLNYHSKQGFSNSHFGFAEPTTNANYDPSWGGQYNKESLGGFPVNISDVILTSQGNTNVEFKLSPEIVIAAGAQGISIDAEIYIDSEYETTNNRKKLVFDKIGLSELNIEADPFGIELEGSVEFYDEQNGSITRHGVRGGLSVGFPMGLEANLTADFGTQSSDPNAEFGTSQNFNYWYLDGMVYLPAGVPIGASGLGVYGFGGGVYINMQAGNDSLSMEEVNSTMKEIRSLPSAATDITHTGVVPTPSYGTYGLKIAGALGTLPEQLINMDLSIHAQFSEYEGLNMVRLSGDVYHLTSISNRGEGGLWSTAFFQWDKIDSDHHIFSGGMSVNLDMMALKGDPSNNYQVVGAAFQVEVGGNNVWYFHAGDPRIDNYGHLEFDFPLLPSIVATGYFMAGHNLPNDLPIPERVEEILSNSNTSDGNNKFDNPNPVKGSSKRSDWDKTLSQSAQGLAFGAALSIDAEIDAFLLYGRLSAFCGFDINITQDENRICYIAQEGNYSPGWNDWYARGQVYAGLEGAIGIEFRFCKKDYDIKLLELAAAIMASGGGPNPEWIEGRAGVSYSVLNGLFEGSKTFDITIGEKCVPAYTDPFAGIDIIYETYPVDDQTDISPFVNPTASFILPIDETFSLPVMEADGSTTDHSFKLFLDEFKVEGQVVNENSSTMNISLLKEEIEVESFDWDEDNKQVSADLKKVLEPFTSHDLTIKLTAEEKVNGNWQTLKDEDGKDWFEKKKLNFSTGKLPYPIPDEEVAYCFPARRQRYFLQDEVILNPFLMEFKTDLKNGQNGYFPEDDETTTYNYFLRFQDLKGGEPVRKDLDDIEESSVIEEIQNIYPDLLPNTIYSVQLLRGEVPKLQVGQFLDRVITFQQLDEDNEMASTTVVNIDTDPLDPGKTSSDNEAIIYQYYFKTSKYRTLAEKLANTDVTKKHASKNIEETDYPIVTIHLDEAFDEVDIYGVSDGNEMYLSPRVQSLVYSNDGALSSTYGNMMMGHGGLNEQEMTNNQLVVTKPVSNLATHQGSRGYFDYCYDRYDGFIEIMDDVWEPDEPYYVYTTQVTIYSTDRIGGSGGMVTGGGGINDPNGQVQTMSSDGTNTSNQQGTITGSGNGLGNNTTSTTTDVDITWDPQRIEPLLNFHPDDKPHDYYFPIYEGVDGLLTDGMINNTWNNYLNQKDFFAETSKIGGLLGDQGNQPMNNAPSYSSLEEIGSQPDLVNEIGTVYSGMGFNQEEINSNLWINNNNQEIIDNMGGFGDLLGSSDIEVVESSSSSFKESITIHYDLHLRGNEDGEAMAEIANDFYYDIHYLRKVPSLQLTDEFFEDNLPNFYENLGNILSTSGYHYEKHNGEYTLKLQPNKGIGPDFLGGSNTTLFTFNKY